MVTYYKDNDNCIFYAVNESNAIRVFIGSWTTNIEFIPLQPSYVIGDEEGIYLESNESEFTDAYNRATILLNEKINNF